MTRHTLVLSAAVVLAVLAVWALGGVAGAYVASPLSLTSISGQAGGNNPAAAAQLGPTGFDCSQIDRLGIDKQLNWRAAQILAQCGRAPQLPKTQPQNALPAFVGKLIAPFPWGGSDVDIILPDGTFPQVTQSEAMGWSNGTTVVVAYNDDRSFPGVPCVAGISYSTDGGVTFQHNGQPLCSGHGNTFADPILVFNDALSTWFAGFLVSGCGGQGIGLWTSPDGINWTVGACAHTGTSDDRESMWVDNNPASPYYGRMYISWNNFNIGGIVQISYSDDGSIWSAPVNVTTSFIQNIQVTGDLQGSGTVYVAGLNEGGGGLNQRTNMMYRSTDGGATWTSYTLGVPFHGPGRAVAGGFALMFSTTWRHFGGGQPAAVGSTVHYAFTRCGQDVVCSSANDHGDIYYTRSTDSGTTWSTPRKMNSDPGTAMQWQSSLAATAAGGVYIGWYDQREVNGGADLDCTPGNANQPCYRRYGAISLDNGATWQPDGPVGDANSPLPFIDPTAPLGYQGDYDYISSFGNTVYDHWADGRVVISDTAQPDVFLDSINIATGTATPTSTGTPPAATNTPTPTVPPPTPTRTATGTSRTPTNTRTPTGTPVPPSATSMPLQTATPVPTSRTPTPAATVTPTATPAMASPTPCTISFSDVFPSDYFYVPVQYLYCHGVISGYADNTFRPFANTTRSQMVKIVVLGFSIPITTPAGGAYTFEDVLPSNPFFAYVETAAAGNIVSGYACGGPGEPCNPPLNRPYFRPYANVTRGQLAKIDVVAAGWTLINPSNPTFEDVLPNTAFYTFVETAVCHGIISGYTCGGPGEPCVPPENRPYFRQYNNATRGQIAKIVYLSLTGVGSCSPPPDTR